MEVTEDNKFEAFRSGTRTVVNLAGHHPLPNLVDLMSDLMERTSPPMRLTRRTLLEIFRRVPNQQSAIDNPHEYASTAVRIIKQKLADHIIDGISYEKIDDWYEMTQLDDNIQGWEEYLVPATRSLYDHVICESDVESRFVEELERRLDVRLYVKLPRWFTVDTPVGKYSPDWAIVMENPEDGGEPLLYLVRETKGANWKDELRPDEQRKIICGGRHFQGALGVSYKVVSSANELP